MIKTVASTEHSNIRELKEEFKDLLGSRFFSGPLSEQEAQKEFLQYYKCTHPILVFLCEEQYFIVYP